MPTDPAPFLGVDRHEVEALASLRLAIAEQERLEELLAAAKEAGLGEAEQQELDKLLDRIDRLNLLKAKAQAALSASVGE